MLENIIAKIKNKIVIIKNPDGSQGTGIVLDSNGIIVTNSHVVAQNRIVKVETNEKKSYIGKVIGSNKQIDFAFILCDRLKLEDFPVLSKRENLLEGEDVVAIGHPHGYDFTVTQGIISTAKREIKGVHYIQTDVPINPGNSGGPLLDRNGEILGINTWIVMNAQNLSFAVPSDYLQTAYSSLLPYDKLVTGYYCPACGNLDEEKRKYCRKCGDDLQEDIIPPGFYENTGYCPSCRTQNEPANAYCRNCGVQLLSRKEDADSESRKLEEFKDKVIKCPGCGRENKGVKYCENCGATLIT
ncbi:MAG: trypsin-like peptidase domain-containing protein [Spirochaetales bacterium]|nr:trypsin-like peptidase domain-containing protein [Spirochaetales bacterium]